VGYLWQNAVRDMDKRSHCASYWYVLETLASYAPNETGICTASIATISKGTGLSIKQVRRHKQKAIEVGHVLLVGNERGGKPGTTQLLRMNIPVEKYPPMGGSRTPPSGVRHPSHAISVTAPMDGRLKKLIKENKEYIEKVNCENFKKSVEQMPTTFTGWSELGTRHGVYKLPSDTDQSFINRVLLATSGN